MERSGKLRRGGRGLGEGSEKMRDSEEHGAKQHSLLSCNNLLKISEVVSKACEIHEKKNQSHWLMFRK